MKVIPLKTLLLIALTLICSNAFAGDADAKPRMNLLIIQTDEHHFNTLGCYGGTIVATPHIDSIAKQGARFTAFYATSPVCSPSRAALVSGLYPQKTPVTTNNIPLDDSIVTFAEILKRKGYATGFAGKWHLDGSGKPQWAPKRKFGFEDNRFMFNRGHWKKLIDTDEGPKVGSRGPNGPNYNLNGADETTFATDWLCDKAVDFIKTNRDKPFCYMVSLPDPHGPNTVRAPYDTMFADVNVPIPVSLKRRPEQIPGWGKSAGVTAAQIRKLMLSYYGMVKCIDDNVGKLLKTLRDEKLMDNTIVVFTSDHGDLCGEHGRLNKGVPYEGSAKIPFLITCPGKIQGQTVVDQAMTNVDFLPTVLSLMEVPLPTKFDGRNAVPVFNEETAESWEDIAFVRSAGRPGTPNAWLAAVTGRYKLVLSTADVPWLIDVDEDPNELTNLYGQPKLREQARWMTERLAEYGKQHKDEYIQLPRIKSWIDQTLANK